MTTTSERRRNMRAESCKSCGKACEALQGYLYRDTNSRTVRRLGRFGWFVKCEECHLGSKSRVTVSMERHAATHPSKPAVRPWSITQAKKWAVVRVEQDGDVAIRIEAGTFTEVVSDRDRIGATFTAPMMEERELGGKPLSPAAASYLDDQIRPLVDAVNAEERAAAEGAIARLIAAGATAKPRTGTSWQVEYRGGRYTLWGQTDGSNRIAGLTSDNRWIETTANELIEHGA